MLDTDTLSDQVNNPDGRVTRKLREVGADQTCVSIVIAAEMRFGALRKGSAKLAARIETALTGIDVLPLDAPVDQHYADIRAALARAGTPIGPNDLWIAAHARSAGCTLVTGNTREFTRVPGLSIENWLAG
jgi:tRNA(fMet)-specific endonuclease VapC